MALANLAGAFFSAKGGLNLKKYILTKDFVEIAETYGIFQNLSGDANIEITNNTNEQGILLKPFQKLTIYQKVYARKITGSGTAQLIVLPFNEYGDDFDEEIFNRPHRKPFHNDHPCDCRRPHEPPPPPPVFPFPPDENPAAIEHENFYVVKVPKDSLNGQKKFIVTINN